MSFCCKMPLVLARAFGALESSFVCRRIVACSPSDDVVSACRQLPDDAEEFSAQLMLKRLYQLKMPQLSHFWERQPKLVLCICPRDDSLRLFAKKKMTNHSSAGNDDQVQVVDLVHQHSITAAQRWRHIHSPSLVSIAPSAQPLPPARAAKVFSWMQSNKAAWEMPGDSSAAVAWQATLRRDAALWGNEGEGGGVEAVEELDLNRWVSKSVIQSDVVLKPVTYEISVVTGKEFGAGTDSRVFCTLYNEDGIGSEELALETSFQNSDPFETGSTGLACCRTSNCRWLTRSHTDTFRHVLPQIGRVTTIRIRYDATGFGNTLNPELKIQNP
jgi:hypothetical protein